MQEGEAIEILLTFDGASSALHVVTDLVSASPAYSAGYEPCELCEALGLTARPSFSATSTVMLITLPSLA